MAHIWLRQRRRSHGTPIGYDWVEECYDDGPRPKDSSGNYYGGGFFSVYKGGVKPGTPYVHDFGVPGVPAWQYGVVPLYASIPDRYAFPFTWENDPQIGRWEIESLMAEAWNKMRPDKPDMSILNSLFELREVPKSLKPKILAHRGTKAWGDYFLAVNFGWIPTLRDAQQFVESCFNMKDRIDQLIRDEGKSVYRRRTLGNATWEKSGTASGSHYGAFHRTFVTQCYNGVPKYTDKGKVGVRTWCVGKFKYFLPEGPQDLKWRADMMLRILGGYPSPSTVWNAIPWSWLVDWFTNAGEVLENIDFTVADRLAAEFAFIMQHRYATYTRTSECSFKSNGGDHSATATTFLLAESKHRGSIDPFGFAFTNKPLSGMQVAILGALGASRMP